jgi:hypothetical protein
MTQGKGHRHRPGEQEEGREAESGREDLRSRVGIVSAGILMGERYRQNSEQRSDDLQCR